MKPLQVFSCWILIVALTACGSADPTTANPIPATSDTESPPSQTSPSNPTDPTTPTGNADIIFTNGTIITMDDANPIAEAIAVQENKIIAVGTNEQVLTHQGANTIAIDLAGKTLVPGFIDSHQHRIKRGFEGMIDLESTLEDAVAQGWTSLNELYVPPEIMSQYIALAEQGRFQMRVNIYPGMNGGFGEDFGDWYKAFDQDQAFSPQVRIGGLKIFTGIENDTRLLWTQTELNALLLAKHQEGWHLAIKTVSTESLEMILIALENLEKTDPNIVNRRVRLEHVLYLTPDQITRVKRLGLIPSIQTNWPGELVGEQDIEQLTARQPQGSAFPWRNLVSAGVIVANGSAYPSYYVDEPTGAPFGSPIDLIYQAVTRVGNLGTQPEAWMLDQTITAEQVLRALTINAAYANFQEDVLGSLTPGKLADMVILSDNPLAVSTPEINNIRVLMTMIDGKAEFCAAEFESLCLSSPLSQPQLDSGPITASSSLADSPANAFDGILETSWNAGAGPEQWIQIDLGQPTTVSAIRLTVAQHPEGETIHQIWGGIDADNLILLHEFRGHTTEFQVLEFNPPSPVENIRFVRVVTTLSPSWVAWREIEVVIP